MAEHQAENLRVVGSNPILNIVFGWLTLVLVFIKLMMARIITSMMNTVNAFYIYLKNYIKPASTKALINNSGEFKFNFFKNRATKFKFFLYTYIFFTMMLCPWLDNLFNDWYNKEPYGFYYLVVFLFLFNCVINYFMVIPSKNTLDFKLFFLKIKSFLLYVNYLYLEFLKIFNFLKNEIFLKSFIFNSFSNSFKKFANYFTYWRPLFKRFSYFGFNRLTKSKFFKNIK